MRILLHFSLILFGITCRQRRASQPAFLTSSPVLSWQVASRNHIIIIGIASPSQLQVMPLLRRFLLLQSKSLHGDVPNEPPRFCKRQVRNMIPLLFHNSRIIPPLPPPPLSCISPWSRDLDNIARLARRCCQCMRLLRFLNSSLGRQGMDAVLFG